MKNIIFLLTALLLLATSTYAQEAQPTEQPVIPSDPFKKERENYEKLLETKYTLLPHRGTFILPVVYNTIPHEDIYQAMKSAVPNEKGDVYKKTEAEFQVSFLLPIDRKFLNTDFDLNFAYTHHAWWQVYNSNWSRPFRETNYMPELFLRHIDRSFSKVAGFDFMGFDAGYAHQSNGQIEILSRSWDRLFARGLFQNSGYMLFFTGWIRLPEKSNEDDNSDILKYMGHGSFELYKTFGKHSLSLQLPLGAQYRSFDFKYSYPSKDRFRWFLSIQSGYGLSLIEYNRPTERYGIGISLDSFMNQSNEMTNQ